MVVEIKNVCFYLHTHLNVRKYYLIFLSLKNLNNAIFKNLLIKKKITIMFQYVYFLEVFINIYYMA